MAVKISELPSGDVPLTGTEQIPVVQGGTTKAITTQDIVELTGVGNKQTVDDDLTALSALTGTGYVKKTGAGTYVVENLVFLTSETDPVFSASAAFGITGTNITNWDSAFSWGNHSLAGYQAALVSGTNIKTVNGASLLGSGDITVSGGTSTAEDISYDNTTSGLTSTDVQGAIDEVASSNTTYPRFIRYRDSWAHLLTQGGIVGSVQALFDTTANRVYYWPICRTHAITIENLCIFYDSTVDGQVGIYSNDTTGGYDHPGTLLASASATGSDIKDVTLSAPVAVPAGDLVWFAYTNAGAYRIRGASAGNYSSLQLSIDRVTSPSFPEASMFLYEDTGSFGLPASASSSLVKALNTSGPILPSVFFQI